MKKIFLGGAVDINGKIFFSGRYKYNCAALRRALYRAREKFDVFLPKLKLSNRNCMKIPACDTDMHRRRKRKFCIFLLSCQTPNYDVV